MGLELLLITTKAISQYTDRGPQLIDSIIKILEKLKSELQEDPFEGIEKELTCEREIHQPEIPGNKKKTT